MTDSICISSTQSIERTELHIAGKELNIVH